LAGSNSLKIVMLVALRVGVIAFLFGFFFEISTGSDSLSSFWGSFINVAMLAGVFAVSVFLLVLPKQQFEFLGLLFVFVISLYRLLLVFFQHGFRYEITTHLLLIIFSLYLITKPFWTKHRSGIGFIE